jgi:hypothetical protein
MVLIKLSTPDAFAFLQDESAPRELRMETVSSFNSACSGLVS